MKQTLENILTVLTSPASINLAGLKFEGPAALIVPVFFIFLFLIFSSIGWIYRDAKHRDRNGFIAVLFILLAGWPLSFLWWVWLRPPVSERGLNTAEQGAAANP